MFTTNIVFTQTTDNNDSYVQSDDEDYVLENDSNKTEDNIHYNFEMGVGFGNTFGGGSTFNTYYKPSISFKATDKLTVNVGLMYVNSHLTNSRLFGENNYQLFSGNISEYYTYVNAQYQLTDRLSVGGSVYYNMTTYDPVAGSSNLANRSNLDHIGYSANFKYKVSESMSIQGEIRVGDRYSPFNQYQRNSFNNSFGNTFSTDPFFGR